MGDYEIVRLVNGVHSIRSRAENETFHPVVGPVQEARELYVEQLRLPVPVRFIFPHAPLQPVTINGG